MKAAETVRAALAFPDPKLPPSDDMMKLALGNECFADWQELVAWLTREFPGVDLGWKFAASVGWHAIPTTKKRRIGYFLPRRGDYELRMILGDHALAVLKKSPYAKNIAALLPSAVRYPEGTAFVFTPHTWHAEVVFALIDAKMRT